MNWLERNLPWVLLTLVTVLSLVTVGFVGASTLALLAGVLGGAGLGAVLADAAAAVGVTIVLIAADVALVVALAVTVLRRASFPTSTRLAAWCSVFERLLPPLRGLGLSDRFEPSVEDRKRAIKRRYVEGELSERAFEREMRDLLDETEMAAPPVEMLEIPGERGEGSTSSSAVGSNSRDVRERERE